MRAPPVSNLPPWLSLLRVAFYIKEEFAMRKTAVSSTLVVCFDGQFWVGIVERVEDGTLSSCRVVFGAEPSNEEVLDFVLREWARLPLGPAVAREGRAMARNPKRRQRQAARELKKRGPSTKAQVALAEQREALAQESAVRDKERREEERRRRFEQRREKAKRKDRRC